MIVDKDKVIVAVNRTARHIFKVQGLSNLVGRRTNSLQINWPLVGMVLQTGIAEGKELDMQGLLLSMRVIPVTNRPGCSLGHRHLAGHYRIEEKRH